MKEKELAKNLVEDANNMFEQGITQTPQIMIDAIEYKEYDFNLLKNELAKLKFIFVELKMHQHQ